MRRIYKSILQLYPAEFRAAFSPEMIGTFEQALADHKQVGMLTYLWFSVGEFAGLLKGSLVQHLAKLAAKNSYITSRCALQPHTGLSCEIMEAQRHLEHLLRSMEFAIAHHNFPKARYYSQEERITRAGLQQLISRQREEQLRARPLESKRSHGCV